MAAEKQSLYIERHAVVIANDIDEIVGFLWGNNPPRSGL